MSSILLNPSARVYTLRCLIVSMIFVIVTCIPEWEARVFDDIDKPSYPNGQFDPAKLVASRYSPFDIYAIICGIFTSVHHILAMQCIPMETARSSGGRFGDAACGTFAQIYSSGLLVFTPALVLEKRLLPVMAPALFMFVSLLFRITTIVKTKERLLVQRFSFLGSCAPSHPPYTAASILLNRSLARPLVRGESKYIIIVRALVMTLVGIGVPAFGIYTTVIRPGSATISTTSVANPSRVKVDVPGDAFISFRSIGNQDDSDPFAAWEVVVTALNLNHRRIDCSTDMEKGQPGAIFATCPLAWSDIQTVYVSADAPLAAEIMGISIGMDDQIQIPLLPGSHLFGLLAWSQRQTISGSFLYSPEIIGLQQNTFVGKSTTSLTLSQFSDYPIKFLRDTADASFLSGISTFGGFWTFVNGTFALFFGANVIYFAFGRRPLSALGVVHLFQRRALVRRWYEDFPAIQMEGGLPGSENAGIVAFIRERLVDLGEDPRDVEGESEQHPRVSRIRAKIGKFCRAFPWKKKIQRFNSRVHTAAASVQASADSAVIQTAAASEPPTTVGTDDFATGDLETPEPRSHRGYILDEIPLILLDMDLSLENPPRTLEAQNTIQPRI
ncbi:hypothetical protein C8R45DRAFT_936419 [Mycena sanguinolenta]|nr:hypothetical protein C8R45DRAFT_936419 [Mycena sanguinolenta]